MKKLYDLVQSLSQGERRYIKIRLNANKSNSLLSRYFDELAKKRNYSFEKIQLAGKQDIKLTQSNLSLLYEVISKHLKNHYSERNTEYSLRGDLSLVKIFMDKGFHSEAKIHCKKLIQNSIVKEEFEILKSAYKEYWNLHLLNGELNDESNNVIQEELKVIAQKEAEILNLEEIYRNITTFYYNYFFVKRDQKYQSLIRNATKSLSELSLSSDKSRHIFFEIKSIESVVHNDLESHHNYRKQQLQLLVNSTVFEQEKLQQLLVLSNTFTYLKSKAYVKELAAYLNFMETLFESDMKSASDSVFVEKYYDIYFTTQSFIQAWNPNSEQISDLLNLFKQVISKRYLSNSLLIGRIYLSLIELLIIVEDYKSTGPLLTEFFNMSKKKKYSKNYLEGDLLFIVENFLQGKMDTFDNTIEYFNRKVKRNEIELDPDQKTLFELLNDIFKESIKPKEYYLDKIANKQTYRLFVHKLSSRKSFNEIRSEFFPIKDSKYSFSNDQYLARIRN